VVLHSRAWRRPLQASSSHGRGCWIGGSGPGGRSILPLGGIEGASGPRRLVKDGEQSGSIAEEVNNTLDPPNLFRSTPFQAPAAIGPKPPSIGLHLSR
jgi:hypothetical protein